MILLHTSNSSGSVFVGTDQLDGETDWKMRETVKFTHKKAKRNLKDLTDFDWEFTVEPPNDQIYSFRGSFTCEEENEFSSIDLNNTAWSNMKLNSNDVYGLVVYTGKETKMIQNSKKSRQKTGKTDIEIDQLVLTTFIVLFMTTLGFFFLSGNYNSSYWYLSLIKSFILFSTFIPNSLKVNLEIAKVWFTIVINTDKDIEGTIVRNSSIPEELGRIQYLLSDKTGTLTRNEMVFKKLQTKLNFFKTSDFPHLKTLIEKGFNNEVEEFDKEMVELVKDCFLCFILCNDVVPNFNGSERSLQASSPDEVALVKFSEEMGFEIIKRSMNKIQIKTPNGKKKNYKILNCFPFKSETKKMGIIVRDEETKKITFFLKGADVVIQEKVDFEDKLFIEEETNKLSREGLRTLAMCQKKVTTEQYAQFKQDYKEAGRNLRNREIVQRNVLNKFEKNMTNLCVTGVEDLLQEEVKPVIQNIRDAGIRVWLLTGDKLETTKCIAISTGFKKADQTFYELTSVSPDQITRKLNEFDSEKSSLIVLGSTLEIIFQTDSLKELFFKKSKKASSVILCRCAPKQKAMVADYLKNKLNKVVCAIGDGGNDVGMITTSNIGIGIDGNEGRQASMASDFSVMKFKNILKLFLWHGRINYTNITLLTNFVIHRGFIITVFQLLFMVMFNYINMNIFNAMLNLYFGTFFTNFSVIAIVFAKDISMEQSFNYPSLYYLVQKGKNLTTKVFLLWTWKSIFQATMVVLLSLTFFNKTYIEIVTITFTSLVVIEFLNVYSVVKTWHNIIWLGYFLSGLSFWIAYMFFSESFGLTTITYEFLQKILLISLASWLPLHFIQVIKKTFFPSQIDKVILEAKLKDKRAKINNK